MIFHRTILKFFLIFRFFGEPVWYFKGNGSFIRTPVVTMVDGLPPELSSPALELSSKVVSRKNKNFKEKTLHETKFNHSIFILVFFTSSLILFWCSDCVELFEKIHLICFLAEDRKLQRTILMFFFANTVLH